VKVRHSSITAVEKDSHCLFFSFFVLFSNLVVTRRGAELAAQRQAAPNFFALCRLVGFPGGYTWRHYIIMKRRHEIDQKGGDMSLAHAY